MSELKFNKPVVIYVPCYNCEAWVGDVLAAIPAEFHGQAECLVVDNHGTDRTAEVVAREAADGRYGLPVTVIRTTENVGYAGTQKLAYALVCRSPAVRKVIMLHGDGQYDPALTHRLLLHVETDRALVSGFRSKTAFPRREETPMVTFAVIRILSLLESALTGLFYHEWHSGFVMYSTDFLRRVPLQALSQTRHIDGELMMCAGLLRMPRASMPIYKRYKTLVAFAGAERRRYVREVFGIIGQYRRGYYQDLLAGPARHDVRTGYEVVTAQTQTHR